MSDKKVGRSPQPQDPERAAGSEIHHVAHDQADFPDVPEAVHGDKSDLISRFKEREARQREQEQAAGSEKDPPERD